MLVLLLSTLLPTAEAVISSHACVAEADNVLRYQCTATTPIDGQVTVTWWRAARPLERGSTGWQAQRAEGVTIYGLVPETRYIYETSWRPTSGGTSETVTGAFMTASLPSEHYLDQLQLTVTTSGEPSNVEYVMFEVGCHPSCEPVSEDFGLCGGVEGQTCVDHSDCQQPEALVIANAAGEVVWYQDAEVHADGGLTFETFDVTPGGTVLGVVDNLRLYEWTLAGERGRTLDFESGCDRTGDGPCPHHDVEVGPDGQLRIVSVERADFSDQVTECSADTDYFGNDGVQVFDADWVERSRTTLIDDYGFDPTEGLGPEPICRGGYLNDLFTGQPADWTHVNDAMLSTHEGRPFLYLSVRVWHHILKVDPLSGAVVWGINGYDPAVWSEPGPWTIAVDATQVVENDSADFLGQHHLTIAADGSLQLLDNQLVDRTPRDARVVRMTIDETAREATIREVYTLTRDGERPLSCDYAGSAFSLEDNVLATCCPDTAIMELADPTGAITPPPWVLEGSCATGTTIDGFFRGVPISDLGQPSG